MEEKKLHSKSGRHVGNPARKGKVKTEKTEKWVLS
jgi:hypothetical protein